MAERERAAAMPSDYDSDPGRFGAAGEATARYSEIGDVHPQVAERLARERHGGGPVLDLGGGRGVLARLLRERGVRAVVADRAGHVAQAPRPAVRADALALPFRDGVFGAVAALWMLYHLPSPLDGLREARRVLRPGGTLVVCTSSRFNDPELADALPGWGTRGTFDAEEAPDLVADVFDEVEVVRWDAPLVTLPDTPAVELYLRGRGLSEDRAAAAAPGSGTPMRVTKRGVLVWARRD